VRGQRRLVAMAFLLLHPALAAGGEAGWSGRITIAGTINDKPVTLGVDTGAEVSILWRKTAERLGLVVIKLDPTAPLAPGQVAMDLVADCTFKAGGATGKGPFSIFDLPAWLSKEVDGVIGWDRLRSHVLQLDIEGRVARLSDELPADLGGWAQWNLVPQASVLTFESPAGGQTVKIGIDTGSPMGVQLGPERWRKWRAARADRPATMDASWCLADGLVVSEVLRVKEFSLGGLALRDVPVSEDTPSIDALFQHSDAVLGTFVFTRLKVVIDGKNGVLYTRPFASPSALYPYNHLGAVFVPKDPEKTDDLEAHVAAGSPAYRAGIRDGDILLRVGELDTTKWRTDPKILPLSRFWSQPAGTVLSLTIERGGERYEKVVTLEEPAAE